MHKESTHARFWSKVRIGGESECWPWLATTNRDGYGTFKLDGVCVGAHRVAFFLAEGRWPTEARHTCDSPSCCNPDHILDGTHADNLADMVARGRQRGRGVRGELNYHSKLTESDVREIRLAVSSGEWQYVVAARYGICQSAVSAIVSRKNWSHVE